MSSPSARACARATSSESGEGSTPVTAQPSRASSSASSPPPQPTSRIRRCFGSCPRSSVRMRRMYPKRDGLSALLRTLRKPSSSHHVWLRRSYISLSTGIGPSPRTNAGRSNLSARHRRRQAQRVRYSPVPPHIRGAPPHLACDVPLSWLGSAPLLAHCDSDGSPPASGSGAPVRKTVKTIGRHREGVPMGAVRSHHEDPAAASSHRPSFESDLLAVWGEDWSEAW